MNMFGWVIACMNVYRGVPTGIYETNNPEACHFVADNCKANIIVVEDQNQLDKILEVSIVLSQRYWLFLVTIVCLCDIYLCDISLSWCLSVGMFKHAFCFQIQDRLPHLKAIVQYKRKLSQNNQSKKKICEVIHTYNYTAAILKIGFHLLIFYQLRGKNRHFYM